MPCPIGILYQQCNLPYLTCTLLRLHEICSLVFLWSPIYQRAIYSLESIILPFNKWPMMSYWCDVLLLTDTDLTDTYVPNNDPSTSVQALEGRVPNYLLLVSLLEHLCSLYETDPEKSKKIFNGKLIEIPEGYYLLISTCSAESWLMTIPFIWPPCFHSHFILAKTKAQSVIFYSYQKNPFTLATLQMQQDFCGPLATALTGFSAVYMTLSIPYFPHSPPFHTLKLYCKGEFIRFVSFFDAR